MRKRITCIVSGRVQMVMYRDYAQRKAKRLGLVGTVQNMEDGTVKVIAEGADTALARFLECLEEGPPFSKVEEVAVTWGEPTEEFQNFSIVYRNFFDRI